jgi:hypothetical protein
MTMRLDIVTNDAGDLVRREHARELGAGVVVALYRLARQAQLHDLTNQAFVRQLEQTHQIIGEYCLRAGTNVSILFADKAVFVAGQLLKGSRTAYESAAELAQLLEWCGGSELSIARDVTQPELLAFAEAISVAMRAERGRGFRSPSPKIRLRAVGDAARLRGIQVERLAIEQRIVRNYATAVVVLRGFFDDLAASRYVLPRRIKRIAQNLVDLSEGDTPAFLGVTEVRNANHDAAGRAVNAAILAVAIAREVTGDRSTLAQVAMAAMMHDVGRPRAIALATAGGPRISQLTARLSEDAEDKLPGGTAAVLTALGRVNEPSIKRTVIAFEALWLRRASSLGPVYRGARAPTIHARIVTLARRYNDLLTPEPGLAPPPPEMAIAALANELTDSADRTVLRMLVPALGLFPVGTVVQLSSDEIGEVVPTNRAAVAGRPMVRVSMGRDGGVLAAPVDVDLARPAEARRIVRVMSIEGWKKGFDGGPQRAAADPSTPSRSAVVPTEPRVPVAAPVASPPARTASLAAAPVVFPVTPREPPPPPSTVAPPARAAAAAPPVVAAPVRTADVSSPGTTPSAVAEAMGRMIEEALRGPAAPKESRGGAHAAASAPSPPTAPSPVAPPAPTASPVRAWRIGESTAPKPVEGASTLAEMRAARPITPAPPAGAEHVPTARGTLGATPLAHVLVYMLDHALTGSIVFREPDEIDHVLFFQLGAVSKVQIARPTSRIGDELVGSGLVTRATINEAVDGARRLGLLLGEYLVGHDLVTREALSKALETQIASRVAAIVNLLPETTYSFYRDVDLLGAIESEGVVSDPLNVILATVRSWHDRARIRATLARIAKHPLVFHEQSDPTHLALTTEERKAIDYVRDARPTTSALFQSRVADEEPVSSLIYALAVTRQFAFKGQKGTPMGGRGAAIPISVAPPAPAEAERVAVPPSARAPNFSPPDFADDLARASALPPEPVSFPAEDVRSAVPPPRNTRPSQLDLSSSPPRRVQPPGEGRGPSRMPPGTLSERPAPMGVDRTNSEAANAERALEAMTHFRLAEAALQRNDLSQAERLAARAVTNDPTQTDYVALHAWIRAMTNGKQDGFSEAIHTLSKLLAEEPDNERALLYRGKLLKKMSRMREALRDFERLLQKNPRHREATQEVRLLKQRATK